MPIWFLLIWLIPLPAKELHVYTDRTLPEIYLRPFKANHYHIRYYPVPKASPREAISFLELAKQIGLQTGGWTLMIRSTDMVYPRFGNPMYRIKGLTYLGEPYMVISRGKTSDNQLARTILHEFGHSVGIPHCSALNCLMNDAKGSLKNIKNSRSFCPVCLSKVRPFLSGLPK